MHACMPTYPTTATVCVEPTMGDFLMVQRHIHHLAGTFGLFRQPTAVHCTCSQLCGWVRKSADWLVRRTTHLSACMFQSGILGDLNYLHPVGCMLYVVGTCSVGLQLLMPPGERVLLHALRAACASCYVCCSRLCQHV